MLNHGLQTFLLRPSRCSVLPLHFEHVESIVYSKQLLIKHSTAYHTVLLAVGFSWIVNGSPIKTTTSDPFEMIGELCKSGREWVKGESSRASSKNSLIKHISLVMVELAGVSGNSEERELRLLLQTTFSKFWIFKRLWQVRNTNWS